MIWSTLILRSRITKLLEVSHLLVLNMTWEVVPVLSASHNILIVFNMHYPKWVPFRIRGHGWVNSSLVHLQLVSWVHLEYTILVLISINWHLLLICNSRYIRRFQSVIALIILEDRSSHINIWISDWSFMTFKVVTFNTIRKLNCSLMVGSLFLFFNLSLVSSTTTHLSFFLLRSSLQVNEIVSLFNIR